MLWPLARPRLLQRVAVAAARVILVPPSRISQSVASGDGDRVRLQTVRIMETGQFAAITESSTAAGYHPPHFSNRTRGKSARPDRSELRATRTANVVASAPGLVLKYVLDSGRSKPQRRNASKEEPVSDLTWSSRQGLSFRARVTTEVSANTLAGRPPLT